MLPAYWLFASRMFSQEISLAHNNIGLSIKFRVFAMVVGRLAKAFIFKMFLGQSNSIVRGLPPFQKNSRKNKGEES